MCDQQAQENPATREDLLAMLATLDIRNREHRHDAVFTVEEAKDLRGTLPGDRCKNLFVRDKKGARFLVVCLEDIRLDMKALASLLEAKGLSFASPGRLRARLCVESGSVTPLAVINDRPPRYRDDGDPPFKNITIILDAGVMQVDLPRFLDATGHQPLIADLGGATISAGSD